MGSHQTHLTGTDYSAIMTNPQERLLMKSIIIDDDDDSNGKINLLIQAADDNVFHQKNIPKTNEQQIIFKTFQLYPKLNPETGIIEFVHFGKKAPEVEMDVLVRRVGP